MTIEKKHIHVLRNDIFFEYESYKYILYAVTRNFRRVGYTYLPDFILVDLATLNDLGGLAIEPNGFLDVYEPRTIVMRDGRVFLGLHKLFDVGYLKDMPLIVEHAGEIFKNKRQKMRKH